MDFWKHLFDPAGFVPRAMCGLWTPGLIRLHNISDFFIWLSYLMIPIILVSFAYKRRRELPFHGLFWLFGLFIVACGTTHLIDIILFYHPIYRFAGLVKLITAIASVATVIALIPIVPQALAMRSPDELEREIRRREEAEIEWRLSEEKLREANAQLHALASTDGLTGLNNQRTFITRLHEETARALRYGEKLSLLILDIDEFKAYNDTHGHMAGDDALRAVALILKDKIRGVDFVARYGGEEFVLLLPNTDHEQSLIIGERLREAIESAPWTLRPLTCSIGAATLVLAKVQEKEEQQGEGEIGEENEPDTVAPALLSAADDALYASKNSGRNRVTHADEM